MNEYIFFTAEGHTQPPQWDKEVNNCQILGRAFGEDEIMAKKTLLKNNPWIEDCGFNPKRIEVAQLFNIC